jgi:hypothetical protein
MSPNGLPTMLYGFSLSPDNPANLNRVEYKSATERAGLPGHRQDSGTIIEGDGLLAEGEQEKANQISLP